jgi:pyruvate formate lyase activating enzyme
VLVPGITDSEEHLRSLRSFLDTLNNVVRVEVLPYHTLGLHKWQKLGIAYTLENVPVPTPAQVEQAREILLGRK